MDMLTFWQYLSGKL